MHCNQKYEADNYQIGNQEYESDNHQIGNQEYEADNYQISNQEYESEGQMMQQRPPKVDLSLCKCGLPVQCKH